MKMETGIETTRTILILQQSPSWETDNRTDSHNTGAQSFFTMFTRILHWARWIQSKHSHSFLKNPFNILLLLVILHSHFITLDIFIDIQHPVQWVPDAFPLGLKWLGC